MSDTITSIKLVLLGDSGVGKTSIVTRYITGKYLNPKPTIGAAFVTKDIILNNQPIELLIWDTSGQEIYRGLAPMYYRSAVIAIIVYDIMNLSTFVSVNYWIKELKANVDGPVVIIVCGNKIDIEGQRVIDNISAHEFAETCGAMYSETSAVTGIGIDRMFEMGVSKLFSIRPNISPSSNGFNIKNDQSEKEKSICC